MCWSFLICLHYNFGIIGISFYLGISPIELAGCSAMKQWSKGRESGEWEQLARSVLGGKYMMMENEEVPRASAMWWKVFFKLRLERDPKRLDKGTSRKHHAYKYRINICHGLCWWPGSLMQLWTQTNLAFMTGSLSSALISGVNAMPA